ncbi:hypothetical protein [Citricoccus sp. K5]|uniref:hypothetical protein n=1 Tax=Citricoccus sp. K5 TaxID=2653135 RepID=UPI0012F0E46D|nr:hypothetical protein [Citricoccus sp. K5]VXB24703.1 hypothetical protein CITRIK5_30039 [Citricoccus sp. K5]
MFPSSRRASFREFEKNVNKSLKRDRDKLNLNALEATESAIQHLLEKAMREEHPLTERQVGLIYDSFNDDGGLDKGTWWDQMPTLGKTRIVELAQSAYTIALEEQPRGTEITWSDMRDGDKVRVVLKSGVEVTYPAVKKTKAEPFMEIFRVGMDIPEKDVQAIYLLDRPVITPDPKVHPVLVVFELADQTIPQKGHAHARQNGHGELIYEYLPEGSDQLVCMNPEIITGWKPGKVVEA